MSTAPSRRHLDPKAARKQLLPDQSVALLKELHLLTREGALNADTLRKLKQVNHLVGLLKPALDDVLERFGQPALLDAGAGNSYLGFVLYELFLKDAGKGELFGVDVREELVRRCEERAQRLGFERMRFEAAELEKAQLPERLHLVVALHACDTATDDALAIAVRKNADHVAVVPCCQAEVARQLSEKKAPPGALPLLWRHAWHRREFGSHLTNVVRALALEAAGYQVTVTELTGWEHSLKNELILGRKVHRENRQAKAQLDELLAGTGVRPKLVRMLWPEEGAPAA